MKLETIETPVRLALPWWSARAGVRLINGLGVVWL